MISIPYVHINGTYSVNFNAIGKMIAICFRIE